MAVEEQCEGNFMDLRKSLFLLTGAEAHLLAKVRHCNRTLIVSPKSFRIIKHFYFENPAEISNL